MAELTITTFLSLDGVMRAPGGPVRMKAATFLMADGSFRTLMQIWVRPW